jgi:hypothetical protein
VLSIDDVRLYELDEKEVKKPHAFQIVSDMSGYKMTVAAHKAEVSYYNGFILIIQ